MDKSEKVVGGCVEDDIFVGDGLEILRVSQRSRQASHSGGDHQQDNPLQLLTYSTHIMLRT